MATISHRAFRNLLERFGGCDEYFTEMINAGSLLSGGQFEKFYIDPEPAPEKIVWQLTGHDTKMMIDAAKVLVELPGLGLDLNMGCSAPDIYRYGAGISWMTKPIEETREMVRGVRDVIYNKDCNITPSAQSGAERKRFSVKLRLGDDDFTDEKFFTFTDMLVREGVELLTLHPRTKKEKLIRPPRYHYAEDLKKRYGEKIKVYLNGNIKDEATFKYATEVCPSVDGVMISRAAVQKPWIFKILNMKYETLKSARESELRGRVRAVEESKWRGKECTVDAEKLIEEIDLEELAISYIDDVEKYQPPEFWKTRLQRFFTYYAMNFKFSHYAQTQWLNAKNNGDLRNRIHEFFEKCPDEKFLFQ